MIGTLHKMIPKLKLLPCITNFWVITGCVYTILSLLFFSKQCSERYFRMIVISLKNVIIFFAIQVKG